MFFLNSALLGVGLSMDAFSVSLANGLHEPAMSGAKMCLIAGVFAFFQAFMPMVGWVCVHTILEMFQKLEKLIPWIALLLLAWIGGKMLLEGIREIRSRKASGKEKDPDGNTIGNPSVTEESSTDAGVKLAALGGGALLLQGIATSIDALSVGFTIAEYGPVRAVTGSLIIAAVTFVFSLAGLKIGKRFGTRFSGGAGILGGLILIGIGLEIFLTGIL